MFRVIEKKSWEEVESIRSLWEELHEKSPRKHFVRSFRWLEDYYQKSACNFKLKVLVVYVLDRPIGILPLVIKPYSTPLGEVRMLGYPLDGWGISYGPVGPNAAATLSGALKHLASSKRDWDFIDLKYVDRDEEDKLRTPNGFRIAGLNVLERRWYNHSCVEFDGAESFEDSISKHAITKYQTSYNRFRGDSKSIQFLRYRSGSNEESDMHRMLADAKNWIFEEFGDSTQKLFQSFVQSSNEIGQCDLNLLVVNHEPRAMIWNEFEEGQIRAGKLLVSNQESKDSGNVLIGKMLKSGYEMGDSDYILPSNAGAWSQKSVSTYRYTHFSRLGIKPQIMKWQNQIKRNLLASTGIATQPRDIASKWKPIQKPTANGNHQLKLFTGTE